MYPHGSIPPHSLKRSQRWLPLTLSSHLDTFGEKTKAVLFELAQFPASAAVIFYISNSSSFCLQYPQKKYLFLFKVNAFATALDPAPLHWECFILRRLHPIRWIICFPLLKKKQKQTQTASLSNLPWTHSPLRILCSASFPCRRILWISYFHLFSNLRMFFISSLMQVDTFWSLTWRDSPSIRYGAREVRTNKCGVCPGSPGSIIFKTSRLWS